MSTVRDPESDQQLPVPGKTNIFELVKKDLDARLALGIKKYGQPLQSFNGRNPKLDLYEELLDALVYAKQDLEESTEIEAVKKLNRILLDEAGFYEDLAMDLHSQIQERTSDWVAIERHWPELHTLISSFLNQYQYESDPEELAG